MHKRNCSMPGCGTEFISKQPTRRYCSLRCKKKMSLQKLREKNLMRNTGRPCQQCGKEIDTKRALGQAAYCDEACRLVAKNAKLRAAHPYMVIPCVKCGSEIHARFNRKYCDPCGVIANREARYKARVSRKHRERLATVESFDPIEIFDRDGWQCSICLTPIDRGLSYPNPMSPSIDHVVAIINGGQHRKANVAASHLHCNLKKGRSVAVEACESA